MNRSRSIAAAALATTAVVTSVVLTSSTASATSSAVYPIGRVYISDGSGPGAQDTKVVPYFSQDLRVDIMDGKADDGNGAFLWPNNTSASQRFDIIDTGNGDYEFKARNSGKCLMLDHSVSKYRPGTRLAQYPCDGRQSSLWELDWFPSALPGKFMIKNKYTHQCMDTNNPFSQPPGVQAVLQQWPCITDPNAWNVANQAFFSLQANPVTHL